MSLNWKTYTLAPLLLAGGMGLAAAGAAFAGSDHAPHGDRGDRGDRIERMAEHLELSDAQRSSVEAILERNRPARRALMQRHKAHREAMRALQPGSADYSTRAQALADEAGTLARDRVLQRTQFQAELATILTPEQLRKMDEHKARAHHGGGHRRWKRDRGSEPAPAPAS